MRRSAGGNDKPCEPNLTPLLDLVLQILMFFIVTVNFASEQSPGDVPLPVSQAARALPKDGTKDPIFVNLLWEKDPTITPRHKVVLPLRYRVDAATGKKVPIPPMPQMEARTMLRDLYRDLSRSDKGEEKEVKNQVIIRADKRADYNEVFQVLQSCSDAGFRNLKIRALSN